MTQPSGDGKEVEERPGERKGRGRREVKNLVGSAALLALLPFALPLLLLSGLFKLALLYYILPLFLLGLGFWAIFYIKGIATGEGKGPRAQQYIYTERNSTRYVSLRMVWPASLHFPAYEGKQLIFCAIPHGMRRER